MKILVPLNNSKYVDKFIDLGADEIYLGFYDDAWVERFGEYSDINRMSGFNKYANKYNFCEMIEQVKIAKSKGVSVFVTLNANCYSREQIAYIEENYFAQMIDAGVDGVIVSGIELGKAALKFGLQPVASTMCAIYNSDIAREYYEQGIKRQILPRDLSLAEIESIKNKVPDISLEVFFMRNGCVFSDCYCLGMHRPECGATCSTIKGKEHNFYSVKNDFKTVHNITVNDELYNGMFHRETCGMCALYRLIKIGVESLKIVGRADNMEAICEDIRVTKENMNLLEFCLTEEEYLAKMSYPFTSMKKCMFGLSCYYPEVRF